MNLFVTGTDTGVGKTLTVRSIAIEGLKCAGVSLNSPFGKSDVAVASNAQILKRLLDAPLLTGLTENMSELPADLGANDRFHGERFDVA